MIARKLVPCIIAGALFFFTSCQKDVMVKDQDQSLETLAAASDDVAVNDVAETAKPIHTPIVTNIIGNCAGYMETLPARYKLTTKKYPLILFIHGIGELGTGVTRVNCCGLPHYIQTGQFPAQFTVNGQKFSFIVVSPQFKVRPTAADIQKVMDYAVKKYRVDMNRIYVTGLSMGGGSTWDYSAVYGQNAAAIVPVCAGTQPTTSLAKSVASKNVPFWIIHSTNDQVVPIQWAKNWYNWIKAANPSVAAKSKLTIWTKQTHNDTWYTAFLPTTKVDGMNVYEWMLHYTKNGGYTSGPTTAPPPTTTPTKPANPPSGNKVPVANAGVDQTIDLSSRSYALLNGPASKDPDGWLAKYTWTKVSGPSVSLVADGPKAVTSAHANKLVVGTYVFRLTVTDDKGATDYDDVTIIVKKAGSAAGPVPTKPATPVTPPPTSSGGNKAPVANAGADQTVSLGYRKDVFLNGPASRDTDGWLVKYSWTKVSGPGVTLVADGPSAVTSAHGKSIVAGTYVFRLTVTDNRGGTASDDVRVVVTK